MSWISTSQAAQLLTDFNGRAIDAAYVRTLASKRLVESKTSEDGKYLLVKREQFENRTVHSRSGRRVENLVSDRRSGKPRGRPGKEKTGEENSSPKSSVA